MSGLYSRVLVKGSDELVPRPQYITVHMGCVGELASDCQVRT
jgi:hypothetical protein